MPNNTRFHRIETILDYIEEHISEPLTVEVLSDLSRWSRWQLQRVFHNATGLSVAQYIRELRLSKAAEKLVASKDRHLDIALDCGFSSEVSFNRAFSQCFGCPPGEYRRRGVYTGVRTPIKMTKRMHDIYDFDPRFLQIRIETQPAFKIVGVNGAINGLLSDSPDFLTKVPQIWEQLRQAAQVSSLSHLSSIGIIDTSQVTSMNDSLIYWAGTEQADELSVENTFSLDIPEQKYAVIPHKGHISELHKTLNWVLHCWLPDSGYCGVNGYELERYGKHYDPVSPDAYMEFWLPVIS